MVISFETKSLQNGGRNKLKKKSTSDPGTQWKKIEMQLANFSTPPLNLYVNLITVILRYTMVICHSNL